MASKNVAGTITEKYLWQGLTQLLAVYDGSDNLLMRFQYADGRMPASLTKDGSAYYLAYDQVGSLRVVADHLGNVVKEIEYDTFGNIITDTNPLFEIPFAFAGGLYDPDTGLIHFGFRDYDPEIGRWTAKDPIFFAGGDVDLFGYVTSDPVNWVDPDGLNPLAPAMMPGAISSGFGVGAIWYAQSLSIKQIFDALWKNSTLNIATYFNALQWIANSLNDDRADNDGSDKCKKNKKKPIESGQDALDQLKGVEKAQKDYRDGKRERPIDFVDKSKQRFKSRIKNYKTPQDFYDDFD